MVERLYLYDTTLRDGAQTQGVDFSVEDKRAIALALDSLGLDYIEGGFPGANPTDTAFFQKRPPLTRARFAAFGMTKRSGRSAANDPSLAAVLDADADVACIVGKSWDYQVDVALEIPRSENIDNIAQSIAAIVAKKREAILDAEHFFDGYRANPDYALNCIQAAQDAGARWIVLCDTNGGNMPEDVYRIVSEVKAELPSAALGIHAHDDTGQGVAVSLAAVRGGVRHVQGTLNGLGERCGNANLCSLIPTLLLKDYYAARFETGITKENLTRMVQVSRLLDEILNRAPDRYAPYVGSSAFTHKGGLHASAVAKDPHTYEHVPPEVVGNQRIIPVSSQSGQANVVSQSTRSVIGAGTGLLPSPVGVAAGVSSVGGVGRVTPSDILAEVKRREFEGYSYDDASASYKLLELRLRKELPIYFNVHHFSVSIESERSVSGELFSVAKATIELDVAGTKIVNTGSGNGPVNALDAALRKDLGKYSAFLADLRLVDYKVRILTSGTEAVTRVMVESRDGAGRRWSTVGVSPNIVDASFEALTDSITYKLLRDGAKV